MRVAQPCLPLRKTCDRGRRWYAFIAAGNSKGIRNAQRFWNNKDIACIGFATREYMTTWMVFWVRLLHFWKITDEKAGKHNDAAPHPNSLPGERVRVRGRHTEKTGDLP